MDGILKIITSVWVIIKEKMVSAIIPFYTAILVMLMPISNLVHLVIFAVLIDTLFGIFTTVKLKGWRHFSSSKLFNVVPKIVLYSLSIILLFFVDKHILGGSLFSIDFLLSKSISVVWVYIEIKSMDENSVKLGNLSLWEHIKNLLSGLKKIKKDINEIMEDTNVNNNDDDEFTNVNNDKK